MRNGKVDKPCILHAQDLIEELTRIPFAFLKRNGKVNPRQLLSKNENSVRLRTC